MEKHYCAWLTPSQEQTAQLPKQSCSETSQALIVNITFVFLCWRDNSSVFLQSLRSFQPPEGGAGLGWKRDSYLNSGLGEFCSQSQLLPHINIRVVGFLEHFLQFFQLQTGKSGPVPPLLTAGDVAVTLISKFIQLAFLLHPFPRRHPEAAAVLQGPAQLVVQGLTFHFRNSIVDCAKERERDLGCLYQSWGGALFFI